jgi:hypothetical protein
MPASNNLQPPVPLRFPLRLHLHLHLGLCLRAASVLVADVPSALLRNGEIVILVSTNSSSICVAARTGAVDVRAEQRLEQSGHGSRTSG